MARASGRNLSLIVQAIAVVAFAAAIAASIILPSVRH